MSVLTRVASLQASHIGAFVGTDVHRAPEAPPAPPADCGSGGGGWFDNDDSPDSDGGGGGWFDDFGGFDGE
jgi:hypothetical protein